MHLNQIAQTTSGGGLGHIPDETGQVKCKCISLLFYVCLLSVCIWAKLSTASPYRRSVTRGHSRTVHSPAPSCQRDTTRDGASGPLAWTPHDFVAQSTWSCHSTMLM